MTSIWSPEVLTSRERSGFSETPVFDIPTEANSQANPEMSESALTSDIRNAESVNDCSAGSDHPPLLQFAYAEVFERYFALSPCV